MTLPCFAQDSLKTASTLSFKPLVGLSLLNGARAGLQVQYNDFIAIEGGVGILNRSMFSYGVILSPFDENRLSFFIIRDIIIINFLTLLMIAINKLEWGG
jgi:hypothetical protein